MGNVKVGWQGRFLEDFEVGDIYRSRISRTITEADNTQFTLLTCNSNQLHFSRVYGEASEWGQPLVNSALTLAVVAGLSVTDVSENGFALGWDEITLPNPVFAGDTLFAETEVLSVRESRSRPTSGIVKVATRGVKQDGTVVIHYIRSIMVWRRAHAPVLSIFPTGPDGGTA